MCELCSVHYSITFWAAAILPIVESVFPPNHNVVRALRHLLAEVENSTLECVEPDETQEK